MGINGQDDPILPVLIVGAGPVGLTLAFLLNKLGVKCAVLERRKEFWKHPQAHVINIRTMEVFRKMDDLATDMMKSHPPVDQWRNFIYCTSLTGRILGTVDQLRTEDFDETSSPITMSHFSQYKLERLLFDRLEALGFDVKHSERNQDQTNDGQIIRENEILLGYKCIAVNPTDQGVTATVSFEKEGKNMEKDIKCKYLVAADGANSSIRGMMGIKLEGLENWTPLVSIHFFSRELGKILAKERPGMLYFIQNLKVVLVVAHNLEQGEFIAQAPYFPPQQTLEDLRSKMGQRLLSELIGQELEDVQIMAVKPWFLHAQVAEKFITSNNRVILAGDSAHRFPPSGGFGLNLGVQDAHNLAWKLAYVIKGIAPQSFLSTYQAERKQIASLITTLSNENFKEFATFRSALGVDPAISFSVHRAINTTLCSILPNALKRMVLNGIFSIIHLRLSDFFLNEKNPIGSSRLAKVRKLFEDRMTIRLRFPAEDLGFRYCRGALVSDGHDNDVSDEIQSIGSRRKYVPSTEPGSRLPHMNIRLLSNSSGKVKILSTLDLTSIEKAEFVLIIAPIEESYKLAQAAFMVAEGLKIPLKVCVMWPENTTNSNGPSEGSLEPWKNIIDVVEIKNSPSSPSWWELCQMENSGAILVRPDDHVAWRSKEGSLKDPELKIKHVLETIFGLKSLST